MRRGCGRCDLADRRAGCPANSMGGGSRVGRGFCDTGAALRAVALGGAVSGGDTHVPRPPRCPADVAAGRPGAGEAVHACSPPAVHVHSFGSTRIFRDRPAVLPTLQLADMQQVRQYMRVKKADPGTCKGCYCGG